MALGSRKSRAGGKTNEDVIPKWLVDHLGIGDMVITPMLVDAGSGHPIDSRKHRVSALKAPVCGKCNHGWMSDLENQVKPILIHLVDDPSCLAELTEPERTTAARWTLKTAAALNRSSSYGTPGGAVARPVPDHHMRILSSGEMPNDVAVVGCRYASVKSFDWLQYAKWTSPRNSVPLLAEDRFRSYKIAIAFRDLVLIVAYYPSAEYRYGVIQDHYVPLFPSRYYHVGWEGERGIVQIPREMPDIPARSSSPVLQRLISDVFVLSKTWLQLVENVATTRLVVEPKRKPPWRH
jgi:hypothetical protein